MFITALLLLGGAVASADTWNERTTLKFSDPVMVPGATLPAGTYIFKLVDSSSDRHLVQITSEDDAKVFATTQAVPTKRSEVAGDIVVKLNPTEAGTPPALKAWFYPGSRFGHEFVYPKDQAWQIAQRTKTIVLGIDVPGTDMERGILYTYEPSGRRGQWRADASTMKDWERWRSENQTASTAALIDADRQATRVNVDDIEDNHHRYIGQTISVDAEVEEVFGPRVFSIDEPNWGDLDGEVLVYLPATHAALIREGDRVTVTGTMKAFVRAELEREWGWLDAEPDIEAELAAKPALVASRIVGGNDDIAMFVDLDVAAAPSDQKPVGTSGTKLGASPTAPASSGRSPISDLTTMADAGAELVGRRVDVKHVTISQLAPERGFWVTSPGEEAIFVLPVQKKETKNTPSLHAGETVSLAGVILQMPSHMRDRLDAPDQANGDIYVYASAITM